MALSDGNKLSSVAIVIIGDSLITIISIAGWKSSLGIDRDAETLSNPVPWVFT